MEKNNQFRTSIGGQALIEGILMRGPEKQAIVVRSPEGLVTRVEELTLVKDKYPILGWPIIRGAVTFLDSMVRGVKALMFSADYYPDDKNTQPSKLDQWLEAHIPAEKLQSALVWVSVLLSLGLTLLLFMLLPTFIAGLFHARHAAVHNLIEGAVKIGIFLGYLILCSRQKDVRRVFCYHGAEHKTIFCYEAGAAADGGKRPHPAQAPSPLRHQLSVRGDRGVHSVQQHRVQLCELAESVGPGGHAPAAADPGGGRHL